MAQNIVAIRINKSALSVDSLQCWALRRLSACRSVESAAAEDNYCMMDLCSQTLGCTGKLHILR